MGKVSYLRSVILFVCCATAVSSCGSSPKSVDAMVGKGGAPAGVIVEYGSEISGSSINADTYQVPGFAVSTVFASNSNPFRKEYKEADEDSGGKDGRFVVILLKDGSNKAAVDGSTIQLEVGKKPALDIRVKQTAPVSTVSGKTVKPWPKAVKAKEMYAI